MIVTIGELRGGVDLREAEAEGVHGKAHARAVAGPTGLSVAGIRGSENGVSHGAVVVVAGAAGATEDEHGLGTVLSGDALMLLVDHLYSFIPSDALPLIEAAVFLCALDRVKNAIRMVHVLLDGERASAQSTLGDVVLGVAFDLNQLPVLDMQTHAAAYRMTSRRRIAARPDDFHVLIRHKWLLPFFSLCKTHTPPTRSDTRFKLQGARANDN